MTRSTQIQNEKREDLQTDQQEALCLAEAGSSNVEIRTGLRAGNSIRRISH